MSQYFKKYIKRQYHAAMPVPKFRTNFANCILEAFQLRGFAKTEADDWDIIWSEKDNIAELYEHRIASNQRINHFKNYFQLCRKDMLIRNLKKHKRLLEREGKAAEAAHYNFYPQTFVLPNEYVLFADEFKKSQTVSDHKNTWIMKPTGRSQGKGIFLFNKLTQISQWESVNAEPYIVQKYISEPLLIGGKKFDIRLYALVTSYSPLTIYLYRGGFARFTHCRYEENKLQQSQIHLTNVAIQKNAQGYDEAIGGKWYLQKLKSYLLSRYKEDLINQCFYKVQEIVVRTLEAMQKVMASDKPNSFELYGFDVLLDSRLQPWLIEVNGSPSMTANTAGDHAFKLGLLDDTLSVIDMEKHLLGSEEQVGGFDLICRGAGKKKILGCHRISLLGTHNNRLDNMKKLAKNYSLRLNAFYETKSDKNRIMSCNSSHHNTNTNLTKRATVRRGHVPVSSVLPLPLKSVSTHSSVAQPSMHSTKGFIIKQKMKREPTNENEIR